MKTASRLFVSLTFLAGVIAYPLTCNGQAWVGADDFSLGISSTNWTTDQNLQGQMLAVGTNGHVSYIVPNSSASEQSAAIVWKGTPTAMDNWTVEIFGHNNAGFSANGSSQLQLWVLDSLTMSGSYRISMAGSAQPQFNVRYYPVQSGNGLLRQSVSAANADFGLRLVHRFGFAGDVEAWYDPKGDGSDWTRLDAFNVTNIWPGMLDTDTFTIAVVSDSYFGPITEGQLWAGNFQISNNALGNIQPMANLLNLTATVQPSFSGLAHGANYQLQTTGDLKIWTNQGSVFTATNNSMIYPQAWNVNDGGNLFFRLQVIP